jgi:hypothetical protein
MWVSMDPGDTPVCGPHRGAQSSSAQRRTEPSKRPHIWQREFIGCWASYRSGDTQTCGFASYWGTRPPESDMETALNGKAGQLPESAGAVKFWGDLWDITRLGLVGKYRLCRKVCILKLYYPTLKKDTKIYRETVLPVNQTARRHSHNTAAFVCRKHNL